MFSHQAPLLEMGRTQFRWVDHFLLSRSTTRQTRKFAAKCEKLKKALCVAALFDRRPAILNFDDSCSLGTLVIGTGFANKQVQVRQLELPFSWRHSMGLILLIVLIVLLLGAVPAYPYSRSWGYAPSGVLGLLLVLLLMGMIPWGWAPVVR
jgi:hypothetical protein